VDYTGDQEATNEIAKEPDLEGCPGLHSNKREHSELLQNMDVFFIHLFSKFKIKKSHFVVSKVTGKSYNQCFSFICCLPLRMMIL
jgi:hypothetical protein